MHSPLRTLATALAVALGAAAPAAALTPARVFDAPGQAHATRCLPLASSLAALRFGDGTPTGFALTGGTTLDSESCPAGSVRLDLHELVPSDAGPLAFHRGGFGYDDRSNVKYGYLRAVDLGGALPPTSPSGGGRGAPCAPAPEQPYRVSVQSIPAGMHYKRPQDVPDGSNSGASFLHYGDPGADQGDRTDIHYTYLTWSFLDVQGGGMVRTLLAPGQLVQACDVAPITMPAWDKQGAVDGSVTARYVRVLAGSCPLYGWMVWSHDFYRDDEGPVAHVVASAVPAPPLPAPDPSCPVAAPAAPPTVDTGDAAPGADGGWTLGGDVDPHGAPAAYRFEYGLDLSYGSATPVVSVPAGTGALPASARVHGLQPGEVYHYRIAALGYQGASYGPDRTLTTAGTRQPDARLAEPAPVLSGLHLAPRAFRPSRSWRGSAARIRFKLSTAAGVRLRFARRAAGVVRGGRCRPVRGRAPRGVRACARWVALPALVTRRAALGSARLRFAGWLGGRPLAAGRYRVAAQPVAASGRHGTARQTGFTLR